MGRAPRNEQERTWRIIDAVAEIASEIGATSAQVALAWLEVQPAVTSVILGARSVEQLTENLSASPVQLSAEHLERLAAVSSPVVSDYPYGEAAGAQRSRLIGF